MKNPSISVILPVYNAEKYLQKAIDSILNQTYRDFEFIIINDGSTDDSTKIINSINDNRVVVIHQKNTGYVKALNYGLSIAKGEWIARMDSDDISYSKRFEEQIKYMKDDIAVIGCQSDIIDENDRIYGKTKFEIENSRIVSKLLKHDSVLIHPSVIINKSKIIEVGGYDCKMMPCEDYDLWLRISKIGKIINVNKSLLALRKHDDNISKIKLGTAITNGFISLAFYFRSNSIQPMSQDEYDYLNEKLSPITKVLKKRLIEFEGQKEKINQSRSITKYIYVMFNPGLFIDYFMIKLLKKQVLFKVQKIAINR